MQTLKPILFSTEMVQAILEGRKTMTRRIIKPQPTNYNENSFIDRCNFKNGNWCFKHKIKKNPDRFEITDLMKYNIEIGTILWVRETFANISKYKEKPLFRDIIGDFVYKADTDFIGCNKWKPSIYMPKEACRLFLKTTNVRVERLSDISEQDAIEEGACFGRYLELGKIGGSYREGYFELWDKINGPGSARLNPWVWVIDFERIEKPSSQSMKKLSSLTKQVSDAFKGLSSGLSIASTILNTLAKDLNTLKNRNDGTNTRTFKRN